MELPIGFDDFGKLITKDLTFVDKTLFIKEFLDSKNIEVSVITRPRRFGKTLNLSTLHHFLAPEVNQLKTKGMFDGLKISTVDNGSYMKHQGKYPVISISFKGVRGGDFKDSFKTIKQLIRYTYQNHQYLLDSERLTNTDKQLFDEFIEGKFGTQEAKNSIYLLSKLIYKHYKKRVFILIDEYDTPIQAGYLNEHYDEIINLMRGVFGEALKNNPYLDRAIITGILRVAKESLFSGLNNVEVFSLLDEQYSQHFGFTEEEVMGLLKEANMLDKEQEIKKWYNGYVFGNTTMYNPWSIVNCIYKRGVLKPYWVNTSDNVIIKNLITKSTYEFKEQFELLLQDKTTKAIIDENVVFGDLQYNHKIAWSLLIMSGYLKPVSTTINERGKTICECAIPNWEVNALYRDIIEGWLGNGDGVEWHQNFLRYLLDGNIEKFSENFGQVLAQTISVHDVAHNPEAFYHGFMLGLAAGLDQNQYELKSNRESGKGRYDIAIIPKEINSRPGIILEIKSVAPPKMAKEKAIEFLDKALVEEAKRALNQINQNQYAIELKQKGISNIVKIGLAFSGKEFRIVSE